MNATSWEHFRGTQGWAQGKVSKVGMKDILTSAPPSLSTRIFQEKPDLRRVVREREQPAVPITKSKPTSLQESKGGEGQMVPKKRSTTTALHPGGIQTEFSRAGSSHFKSRRGEHKALISCLGAAGVGRVGKPFRNKGVQLLRDKPAM